MDRAATEFRETSMHRSSFHSPVLHGRVPHGPTLPGEVMLRAILGDVRFEEIIGGPEETLQSCAAQDSEPVRLLEPESSRGRT